MAQPLILSLQEIVALQKDPNQIFLLANERAHFLGL